MGRALGIDIGSTTLSFDIVDIGTGSELESVTIPNDTGIDGRPYEKLYDADRIMRKVQEELERIAAGGQYPKPECIGVTGQMHGILYVNECGRAISPLYSWMDGSGDRPLAALKGRSAAEYLTALTGETVGTGYGIATLLSHTLTGEVPQGAAAVCTIADYVAMQLTGKTRPRMHSSNAASLGAFDRRRLRFKTDVLAKTGIDCGLLPDVADGYEIAGQYLGIPVSLAIGDNQASFFGSVGDPDGAVLVNIGTGSQVSFLTHAYDAPPGTGLEVRPLAGGRRIMAGSSLCGGRAISMLEAFFRKTAELVSGEDCGSAYPGIDRYLDSLLESGEEDALRSSLSVDTCFRGTREEPRRTGSVAGITPDNFTPEELIKGFYFGIAEELKLLYDASGGPAPGMLVAAGGAVRKSRFLRKVLEMVFGCGVSVPGLSEAAAYGSTVYARAARLITGVRVGEQELAAFQGADNMLMAGAVESGAAEIEIVVHASAPAAVTLNGDNIAPEIPVKVKLNDGFNSFTITAELGGKTETVFVNIERLPAGLYSESTRPVYHFTPYRHQMNDPNGLVYDAKAGLYHLFFQCNRPFASGVDAKTRTTGWGHAVSRDLVTWNELPMALTPDLLGAAWSGSGVVDRDNTSGLFDDSVAPESRLVVFYANVYGDETYGMAKISMAYSLDGGDTWIKYGGNPVVKNAANRYGAGLRDPKVIRFEDPGLEGGWCWLMVTCGDTHLFRSKDLIHWDVQGDIVRDVKGNIVECECPDLFLLPVDGDENNKKWILTCGGVSYLAGDLVITEEGNIEFRAETEPVVNLNGIADQIPGIKAPEIYATQTFYTDPLGRWVSMSWIRDPYQNWRDKIWNSAQSIPLVNTLRSFDGNVKLCRCPVAEIETARKELLLSVKNVELSPGGTNLLGGVNSDCFDLLAVITPGDAKNIELWARYDGSDAELKLRYSVPEQKLYVAKGGEAWQGVYDPEVHLGQDGKLRLRLMMDRICYDIFGNEGEAAIQGILYTRTGADGLMLRADGDARIDSLEVWSMAAPSPLIALTIYGSVC